MARTLKLEFAALRRLQGRSHPVLRRGLSNSVKRRATCSILPATWSVAGGDCGRVQGQKRLGARYCRAPGLISRVTAPASCIGAGQGSGPQVTGFREVGRLRDGAGFRQRPSAATLLVGSARRRRQAGASCRRRLGVQLRAYAFERYKTKRKDDEEHERRSQGHHRRRRCRRREKSVCRMCAAVAEGVLLARDLVNEPANVLYSGRVRPSLRQLEENWRRRRSSRSRANEEARHECAARRLAKARSTRAGQ